MGRDIERFKKTCREKGIFAASLKTVDYLVFLKRKRALDRIWRDVSLKSGSLEIRGWNTGPRLYWDGMELTKNTGLNTSIFVNGKWHDSSKSNWRPKEIRPDILILKNSWRSLPVEETWVVSSLGNGKITCEVNLESARDIEFIEQKFTVMFSERFNLWFDNTNKISSFPQFKDWTDIRGLDKNSAFIGVESDIDKSLPKVILKRQEAQPKFYSQIQNSDFKTRARLLNFIASSRDTDLKYKKGTSAFFKMEIEVK